MTTDLKQRIEQMREKLNNRAPVTEVHVSTQLFVTPDPVCQQMTEIAGLTDSDRILEPSAGTGAILRAARAAAPGALCDAVELNGELYRSLLRNFPSVTVCCGDFLQFRPNTRYSKILMNPPFQHAQDIRHIKHALTLLEPGGLLVGVCLNGPRQQDALKPLCDVWEPLPRGTFTYTDISAVVLSIKG